MKPHPRHYRPIWTAAHGELPQQCEFCSELVLQWGRGRQDGVIHHRDEDRWNNDIENLMLGHRHCHTTHHSAGSTKSDETRAKMSASASVRYSDPLEREKTAVALRGNTNGVGRKDSDETKAKRAAHHVGAKRSPEALANMRAGQQRRRRAEQH